MFNIFITDVQIYSIKKAKSILKNISTNHSSNIFFVFEGNGKIICDGITHNFSTNSCYNFFNFENIEIISSDHTEPSIIQIGFNINNDSLISYLNSINCTLLVNSSMARSTILTIINEFSFKSSFYEDTINLSLIKFLYLAITYQSNINHTTDNIDTIYEINHPDPIMKSIIEYIETNLSEDISIDSLKILVNRTRRQISNLFKQYYNCTTLQWINRRRLAKSKELLLFSCYSITQIAEITGFRSIHYFSRFFKEKERLTPIKYKKSIDYSLSNNNDIMPYQLTKC